MKQVFCFYLLLIAIVAIPKNPVPFEFLEGIISEFKEHDSSRDNLLSKQQLSKLVEARLKEQPIHVPGVQLSQTFYKQAIVSYLLKHDKNKDGLSVEQFEQLIKKQIQASSPTQQKQQFEEQFAL